MEAVGTSETSINFYEIAWRSIPEECHFNSHRHENLKSHSVRDVYKSWRSSLPKPTLLHSALNLSGTRIFWHALLCFSIASGEKTVLSAVTANKMQRLSLCTGMARTLRWEMHYGDEIRWTSEKSTFADLSLRSCWAKLHISLPFCCHVRMRWEVQTSCYFLQRQYTGWFKALLQF
jgi:hypothetical protein